MANPFALIIEDNEPIGFVYEEGLKAASFDAEQIRDGRRALERLKEVVPDLIILDMNLPYVSGHYIFKQIRADQRLANTHVIIATANAPMAEALQNQITDRDIILIKPVSASQLRDLASRLRP
jgi:DNA-binding response OmpR family regulator